MVCVGTLVKLAPLNTLLAILTASSPDIRTIEIPPSPMGVEIAAIVSNSVKVLAMIYLFFPIKKAHYNSMEHHDV